MRACMRCGADVQALQKNHRGAAGCHSELILLWLRCMQRSSAPGSSCARGGVCAFPIKIIIDFQRLLKHLLPLGGSKHVRVN